MGVWTTGGRNLVAGAIQSTSTNATMTYAGISPGCGILSATLNVGTNYSSLSLSAPLPANLSGGVALLILDGNHTQTVTTSGTQLAGVTSLAVVPFTASYTFAAGTAGVAPIPQASDIALYNETARVAVLSSAPGAGAGETLTQAYADGSQPTAVYLLVGYFGGATATASPGTGTLMVADNQYWNHSQNVDTFMYQADTVI